MQSLSEEVAAHLGLQLSSVRIRRFADGEIYVQVQESIRGCDVFLIQPTCPTATASVNDMLMELMVTVDACRWDPAAAARAPPPLLAMPLCQARAHDAAGRRRAA